MKAKKRANFKAKKEAYLQAKAAYHACRYDTSDEEEETSNSDNDEDSNKSFSTYLGVRKGDQYHLMQPTYLYWNI